MNKYTAYHLYLHESKMTRSVGFLPAMPHCVRAARRVWEPLINPGHRSLSFFFWSDGLFQHSVSCMVLKSGVTDLFFCCQIENAEIILTNFIKEFFLCCLKVSSCGWETYCTREYTEIFIKCWSKILSQSVLFLFVWGILWYCTTVCPLQKINCPISWQPTNFCNMCLNTFLCWFSSSYSFRLNWTQMIMPLDMLKMSAEKLYLKTIL